ncbi:MAG: NAD(+) synthase [Oscillospiraceae bacterium]|nr:NAD(+) synthase [Oscillospiraceae bacterium]
MRDYKAEKEMRVAFIRRVLEDSGARGIVYGNSGGKDSALVGILCKLACDDTLGLILPCGSERNYGADADDAKAVSKQFGIENRTVDLKASADALKQALAGATKLTGDAVANIAPRLRMTTLYAAAASEGRIVAGTGNRSEGYMGYFTKWGDGAYDFNPIADLTVTEIYEFLNHLGAPKSVIEKPPSAGLYDGQTDETEMGITYKSIDGYLLTGKCSDGEMEIIDRFHKASEHKRNLAITYKEGSIE